MIRTESARPSDWLQKKRRTLSAPSSAAHRRHPNFDIRCLSANESTIGPGGQRIQSEGYTLPKPKAFGEIPCPFTSRGDREVGKPATKPSRWLPRARRPRQECPDCGQRPDRRVRDPLFQAARKPWRGPGAVWAPDAAG